MEEEDAVAMVPDTSRDEEIARQLFESFQLEHAVVVPTSPVASIPAALPQLTPVSQLIALETSNSPSSITSDEEYARRLQEEFDQQGVLEFARRLQADHRKHPHRYNEEPRLVAVTRNRTSSAAPSPTTASPFRQVVLPDDLGRERVHRSGSASRAHRYLRRASQSGGITVTELIQQSRAEARPEVRSGASQTRAIASLPVSRVPDASPLLTEECQVCFEMFEAGVMFKMLPCLHKYHVACIDNWLTRKPTCPVCQNSL